MELGILIPTTGLSRKEVSEECIVVTDVVSRSMFLQKGQIRHIKARLDDLKGAPCADCDLSWPPYVMSFDLTGKDLIVSPDLSDEQLERVAAEADLVCANCLRIRMYRRKNYGQKDVPDSVR